MDKLNKLAQEILAEAKTQGTNYAQCSVIEEEKKEFASSDRQGNGCWYDEARVRRGVSTPDWIQANWDTQRIGTDFLAAGPVVDNLLPTILLLR